MMMIKMMIMMMMTLIMMTRLYREPGAGGPEDTVTPAEFLKYN